MQIPCTGHVCFLLNNVRCCGRHICAHNQFRDHRSALQLPLVSISRRSLGLPATTFRRFLSSFKGSSLYEMTAMQKYSALHNALCSFYNSVLVSVLPDNVTFSCILSGMLVHHNSNRFIQRPFLVVLHVSSTPVVGSPANSVDVF